MSLTTKAVEAAKPREKGYKLADAAGLYLFVTPVGGKSWRANYSQGGKQGTRTYGRFPSMSLAEARRMHAAARDPAVVAAAAVKSTPTFEAVAKQWWAAAGFKDTLLRWKMKPEVVMQRRRTFSREFKLEAVKLVSERGVSVLRRPRTWTRTRTCCANGFGSCVRRRRRPSQAMASRRPRMRR